MTDRKDDDTRPLKRMEGQDRRDFLRTVATLGFTTAVVAAGAGAMSKSAAAQTKAEEQERGGFGDARRRLVCIKRY